MEEHPIATVRSRGHLICLLVSATVLLGLAETSSAARAPTAAERKAIVAAFNRNPHRPNWESRCLRIRVSTADPRWSVAGSKGARTPRACFEAGQIGNGFEAYKRGSPTAKRWRRVYAGSGDVPCRIPENVRNDLFRWARGACFGPGASTVQPPPADNPPPAPPAGSTRDNPIPRGTTATVAGGWQVRVDGVIPNATEMVLAENQFNDPPASGKQFFIATITATFTGTGSSRFDGSYRLRAVGPSAVSYSTFNDSCGVIPNEISDAEVFTGGTITGNVCWQITSSDATGLVMYDDAFLAPESDRVYFALS